MKTLIALAFAAFAQANPAALEIHGLDQPAFQSLPEAAEIPARLNAAWGIVSEKLKLPDGPAPVLYFYVFGASNLPPRLNELQERVRLVETPVPTLEEYAKRYAQVFGMTYAPEFYREGEADFGRVIQLNPNFLFTQENFLSKGLGLYVSSHEMMHYALNQRGIDPKFQHCLMVEPRGGRDSLLLETLNEEIQKGWASEFLKRNMRGAHGYGEDQLHCEAEAAHWENEEKKAGQAPAFRAEVTRLASELP